MKGFLSTALFGLLSISAVIGHDHTDFEDGTLHYCAAVEMTESLLSTNDEYAANYEYSQTYAEKYAFYLEKTGNTDFAANNARRRMLTGLDITVPVVTVPIVFHVLYTNDDENLSDEQLYSQLRVINEDFRGTSSAILNGAYSNTPWVNRIADSRIEFEIAGIERKDVTNEASFVCNDNAKRSITGGSDAWDQNYYLNVWICNLVESTGNLGYAYYPCLLDTSIEYIDGIMMDNGIIGSEVDDPNNEFYWSGEWWTNLYRLGRVLTHEIGHYFNLVHTWGNSVGCNVDDFVSDTPLQYNSNFFCADDTTNSCFEIDDEFGTDLRDIYEDFMDYSQDDCKDIFTIRQAWRMRATLSEDGCRSDMYNAGVALTCDNELGKCNASPCAEDEAGECAVYQDSNQGCSQCEEGYFKYSSDYSCISCFDTFGIGCLHCQDGPINGGCAQCDIGYSKIYDDRCGVYVCIENGIDGNCEEKTLNDVTQNINGNLCISPCDGIDGSTPCECSELCNCKDETCHSDTGCSQCEDGFFMKNNGFPCVDCNEYFGDDCLFCQDFNGCGQCKDGCERVLNEDCGLYECINCPFTCPDGFFCCNDGCQISASWEDDGWCDCAQCEDELFYTCDTCIGGCPQFCGDFEFCPS